MLSLFFSPFLKKKIFFSLSLIPFYFLTFFCSLFFLPFIFYLSPILLFQPLFSVTSSQTPLPPLIHVTNGCLKIWLWFKPHLGSYCVWLRACVCMHIICLILTFLSFFYNNTLLQFLRCDRLFSLSEYLEYVIACIAVKSEKLCFFLYLILMTASMTIIEIPHPTYLHSVFITTAEKCYIISAINTALCPQLPVHFQKLYEEAYYFKK